MATDFWSSSHYKRWIVDRATLKRARSEDLKYVPDPSYLSLLHIFFANLISKLGKKLQLRQRVIATAIVFFRRFYIKNSYCDTDPFIVVAACCYLASKAEESPLHIKNVVAEARLLFSHESYGIKSFPSDNSKLAEMEFYLIYDLECDLTVFHPYRTLLTLCRKENTNSGSTDNEAEAGELAAEIEAEPLIDKDKDGEIRYWGTGEGQLELQEGGLQMAWFIINDTYRSELCLLYPPHLIAVTAIYLTLVLHAPTRDSLPIFSQISGQQSPANGAPQLRRSPRQPTNPLSHPKQAATHSPTDPITFLASLDVSLSLIATIAQEIISLYKLWQRYQEDIPSVAGPASPGTKRGLLNRAKCGNGASGVNSKDGSARGSQGGSPPHSTTPQVTTDVDSAGDGSGSVDGPKMEGIKTDDNGHDPAKISGGNGENSDVVTASFLCQLLLRMRESRMADSMQSDSGRLAIANRLLERAQVVR